ncbi:MAG TPA: type IX secretion system membrane protein PorP/SprF [Flavobacteriales bacterium]|nr:type IX secretion system membrane protein PorP/SprF [Flavobacteriales bacterium]HIN39365.1 type IX secretion system membrane protein PorP/SprF [Flavobacteriales bacterium]
MEKLIKQIFIFVLLSILLFEAKAQQLPQYSQYLINEYVLNPAIGGTKAYYETKSNHRFQWVGITDAPRTFILSMHGPLKAENMGVGGYLFTDVTGPTSRVGAYGSYAYHVQLNETMKLSMGLFGGIVQYNIDGSKITLVDKTDPLGSMGIESVIIPDAGFGLYWYTEDYYLGASVPQLLQNKLKLSDTTNLTGKLNSHYYVMGGYKFKIGTDFEIEPSFLMKMVIPVPMQFDISSKVIYQKMVWVGASYRTFDSMSALIGYSFEEKILFGYSFDFTLSDLKNYNSGTHEVMLGLRFASSKKKKIEKKEEGLFE